MAKKLSLFLTIVEAYTYRMVSACSWNHIHTDTYAHHTYLLVVFLKKSSIMSVYVRMDRNEATRFNCRLKINYKYKTNPLL